MAGSPVERNHEEDDGTRAMVVGIQGDAQI